MYLIMDATNRAMFSFFFFLDKDRERKREKEEKKEKKNKLHRPNSDILHPGHAHCTKDPWVLWVGVGCVYVCTYVAH